MLYTYEIKTQARDQFVEITDKVQAAIEKEGLKEGIVVVYCPHTTGGITINENADPDVVHDMLMRLDEVYPWNILNTDMAKEIQLHT